VKPASAADRQRARRIHRESAVVNLHDHMGRPQDFEDMRRGGVTAKVYKPINDGKYYDEHNRRVFPAGEFDWTGHYRKKIEQMIQLEGASNARVMIVRRFSDFERARRAHKSAIILGNEGSLPLGRYLEAFDSLYRAGVREVALFWPAGRQTKHILEPDRTLTPHARAIIERANELGVAMDTCHLSGTPALLEVVSASTKPIIHSHGAGRYPRSPRLPEGDLDDREIRAIADKGGIIGVHFCTYIRNINGWNWQPTIEDLMAHVRYLVKIGGIESVGIGSDYFPYNAHPFDKAFQQRGDFSIEDRDWSNTFVQGLENISGMPFFTEGLVRAGFDDSAIRKILGENALRVFRSAWKE
jgi:membrane dipeptidase